MLVGKGTTVEKTDKTFNVGLEKEDVTITPLSELNNVPEYNKINCEVKVLQVDEPVCTSSGKMLQNVIVADQSGVVKMNFWEDDRKKVAAIKSYRFEKVSVKEYRGQKYLSVQGNTVITEIEDVDVDSDVGEEAQDLFPCIIENAKVIGVVSLEAYLKCIKCNAKIDSSDGYDTCRKCSTAQCMEECESEVVAQLMVKSGDKRVTLKAFTTVLEEIAEAAVNRPFVLLTARLLLPLTTAVMKSSRALADHKLHHKQNNHILCCNVICKY